MGALCSICNVHVYVCACVYMIVRTRGSDGPIVVVVSLLLSWCTIIRLCSIMVFAYCVHCVVHIT